MRFAYSAPPDPLAVKGVGGGLDAGRGGVGLGRGKGSMGEEGRGRVGREGKR